MLRAPHSARAASGISVESRAAKNNKNLWPFWPAGSPQVAAVAQPSVVLDPDDACIDVRIFGVEGRPLLDEHLCSPDRCATPRGGQCGR